MWNNIVNPKTGRKVSIYGSTGKKILKNYLNANRYMSLYNTSLLKKQKGGSDSIETPGGKIVIYQLISDVDDTLHPSGWFAGSRWHETAGVDYEGIREQYYPCVKKLHSQFYNKFELPTVIISANPRAIKSEKMKKIAKELGIKNIEYNGGEWVASIGAWYLNMFPRILRTPYEQYSNIHYSSMAIVKIQQITNHTDTMKKKYEEMNIEYRAIWIGDNGQGDLIAAKELLNDGKIYAALIHLVDPTKQSGISSSWARIDDQRLFSFNNYDTAISQLKNQLGLSFLEDCDEDASNDPHQLARQKSFDEQSEKELRRSTD